MSGRAWSWTEEKIIGKPGALADDSMRIAERSAEKTGWAWQAHPQERVSDERGRVRGGQRDDESNTNGISGVFVQQSSRFRLAGRIQLFKEADRFLDPGPWWRRRYREAARRCNHSLLVRSYDRIRDVPTFSFLRWQIETSTRA